MYWCLDFSGSDLIYCFPILEDKDFALSSSTWLYTSTWYSSIDSQRWHHYNYEPWGVLWLHVFSWITFVFPGINNCLNFCVCLIGFLCTYNWFIGKLSARTVNLISICLNILSLEAPPLEPSVIHSSWPAWLPGVQGLAFLPPSWG